jgi:acyl-CoA synthetase (NDP forming)
MKDQKVDIVLSCFVVNRVWTVDADRLLNELKPFQKKPMAALVMGDYGRVREFVGILEGSGVPVFATPERAVRALGALWSYYALSREY